MPQKKNQDVLASYVGYARVTGHILELFHKSIHNRSVDNDKILKLTSEIHAWWNSLPDELQGSCATDLSPQTYSFAPLFIITYQQLILLVNRPFLSLDPATPIFQSSLQICVGASQKLIATLRDTPSQPEYLASPGILSAIWMAGLVVAFACELNMYPLNKCVS